MPLDFFQYKDFNDFITKMNFTILEGIKFLEEELKKREVGNNEFKHRFHSIC